MAAPHNHILCGYGNITGVKDQARREKAETYLLCSINSPDAEQRGINWNIHNRPKGEELWEIVTSKKKMVF